VSAYERWTAAEIREHRDACLREANQQRILANGEKDPERKANAWHFAYVVSARAAGYEAELRSRTTTTEGTAA
jgi:hypothetical protein